MDALVRTDDGGPEHRLLAVAAHSTTSRRSLACSPHHRRFATAMPPLHLRPGGKPHAQASRLHQVTCRSRRELVHSASVSANELLVGPAGKRTPPAAVNSRSRLVSPAIQ